MVQLEMGIWAAIAAGGVMVMLVALPILGCIFSRSRKSKKAAEMEESAAESAAEKGEVLVEAVPTPKRPVNAVFQKPAVTVSQHDIGGVRTTPSTQSMSPSYQSQASTLSPPSPLRNSTNSPHLQPMWTKPSP